MYTCCVFRTIKRTSEPSFHSTATLDAADGSRKRPPHLEIGKARQPFSRIAPGCLWIFGGAFGGVFSLPALPFQFRTLLFTFSVSPSFFTPHFIHRASFFLGLHANSSKRMPICWGSRQGLAVSWSWPWLSPWPSLGPVLAPGARQTSQREWGEKRREQPKKRKTEKGPCMKDWGRGSGHASDHWTLGSLVTPFIARRLLGDWAKNDKRGDDVQELCRLQTVDDGTAYLVRA